MGTLPEWWTGPYPEVSSTKTATDYLDALGANLTRKNDNGDWVLSTGSQELIRTASAHELDSFVLGFALAHLICERHGLIGQRSGPIAMPHPAELQVQPEPAPEEQGAEETDGEEAGEDQPAAGEDEGQSD